MGSDNVRKAYATWGHLPDAPFRTFIYMSLVSIDDDDPPVFYQGREALSFALGRMTPAEPSPMDFSERAAEFRAIRDRDFKAVRRCIDALVKNQAIWLVQPSAPGRNATYGLRFDGQRGTVSGGDRGRSAVERGTVSGGASPVSVPRRGGVGGVTFETNSLQDTPKTNTKSPLVSSSLANFAEIEMNYDLAAGILGKLPDLGGSYLDRITEIEGMRNRVIAAAILAITENPTLAPKEAS